ncbi:hypothetical protein Tco_1425902 [Tanacetum coccineum]
MAESAKRHENNSNIIKEIRDSTDTAIRNQGASIKILEIQIRQMSKVLQERGFRSLPSSRETNPRDQVKSISTAKADLSKIRRIRYSPYAVSGSQHRSIFSEIDKDDLKGKRLAETLIDIPVFIGNFSVNTCFTIINEDDVVKGVVLDMPFFKKYMSCQMIMKKFAHGDENERIMDE